MRRDVMKLATAEHDLLVIGGGIHGACIAWDAALRGLTVALVERDDFGAGTSANSLRVVHGGLRYLARGDLIRMRESIRERSALLRIAPGLVEPLPVLVPTGPPGVPGRAALSAALVLTHLLSPTRNSHLHPSRRIGVGRLLSAGQCAALFPALDAASVTGGALWYDARMTRPERLTLAFVASAASVGARVANYAEVESFEVVDGLVRSVALVDRLSGARHRVRARQIVIAAGPWTWALADKAREVADSGPSSVRHALALNLVIGRRLAEVAVGLRATVSAGHDPGGSGGRFLFLAPQEQTTLLGTWYGLDTDGDIGRALALGAEALLAAFNRACPGLRLSVGDVVGRQWGRLPLGPGGSPREAPRLAERPLRGPREGDPANLLTVEGVKYTTARAVAENVVDAVLGLTGMTSRACRTATTPLVGAELVRGPLAPVAERIRRAAREEMAVTLSDVVYRRTELGDPPGPDREAIRLAAGILAEELGWDEDRCHSEEASLLGVGAA